MQVIPEEGYLVAVEADMSKTEEGIYVPESGKSGKKYLQVKSTACKYKKGTLIIPKGTMMQVEVEFKQYFVIHEDDVCATLSIKK